MGHNEIPEKKELKVTTSAAVAFGLLIIVFFVGLMSSVNSLNHEDEGHANTTEAHAH
ncbi:MAG TPA: hypothetical protein VLZ83_15485 [Edaphocola sp.]|nr:hypothetical protein [Edaphocola sp.]